MSDAATSVRDGILSTRNLHYWQRLERRSMPDAGTTPLTSAPGEQRRVFQVLGIGRTPAPEPASRARRPAQLPTEGLFAGLAAAQIPVAFEVLGTGGEVAVRWGVWTPVPHEHLAAQLAVLRSVLDGAYPLISAEPAPPAPVADELTLGGVSLGVPAPLAADGDGDETPLDRVLRAVVDARFRVLVLAQPVSRRVVADTLAAVLNEQRAVESAAAALRVPSPLAEHFSELLKRAVEELTAAEVTGAWRAVAYLQGDVNSYWRLAAVWRSVLGGQPSMAEPLQVVDSDRVPELAGRWAMPDGHGDAGPGHYRHPFAWQSLMSSGQLARMAHCPSAEHPGFHVRPVVDFGANPSVGDGDLDIGAVIHRDRPTRRRYATRPDALTRHALVAGVTGSGKTNTVFHVLEQVAVRGIPFLVLEPAKAEYRRLRTSLPEAPAVLTAGAEAGRPLRLNPFAVPAGVHVATHVDLLRAALGAAFDMWAPLPQVLEAALYGVYADLGWDFTSGANRRLDGGPRPPSYPTLTELVDKVEQIVPRLGYDERVTADLRAALRTRLNALRVGAKGRMLDRRADADADELFQRPTVIEMESLGDDEDKALVMGLLLIRLIEHRRLQGPSDRLRHVLVIEEAHRLLSDRGRAGAGDSADPRRKAVEAFAHLIAEVRAYGQAIVIAEQSPSRLFEEALKATGTKIVHRVVAASDRMSLAATMRMDDDRSDALTTLAPGQALVYGEGDDLPVLVDVPIVDAHENTVEPAVSAASDDVVDACALDCSTSPDVCGAARRAGTAPAVRRTLSRLLVSAGEDPTAVARIWPDLRQVIAAGCPPRMPVVELVQAAIVHGCDQLAGRRGAQADWTFTETEEWRLAAQELLLAQLHGQADREAAGSAFVRVNARRHRRLFDPYPACSAICRLRPGLCLYRWAASDLREEGTLTIRWRQAESADLAAAGSSRPETWEVASDAGYRLVEHPEPDAPEQLRAAVALRARRASLCFAQQQLVHDTDRTPRTARRSTARLLRHAAPAPAPRHGDA